MLPAVSQNYLNLGVVAPILLGLLVITIMKLTKKSNRSGLFVKLFLIVAIVVYLYNWLIKWVASKGYNMAAWVLAVLPLLSVVFIAYYYIEHEQCLNGVHSIFSECLPEFEKKILNRVANL